MHAFRKAVEARDVEAMTALLAEDVVFRSPAVFRPYEGRAVTAAILAEVIEVFEDFRYVREIGHDGDRDHALVFEARVGDRHLTGCDFLHLDEDGLIDDFMVMVRPLTGAHALAGEMGARWEAIEARAAATG